MKALYKKVNGKRVKMSDEEIEAHVGAQNAISEKSRLRKKRKKNKQASNKTALELLGDKFNALLSAIANAKSLKELKSAEIIQGDNKKQASKKNH